jgi:flagellar motor protein MotB
MSSKILFTLVAAFAALSSVGCSSAWMSREEFDRETAQMREYNQALEKENADLKLKGADYDRLKSELEANGESSKFYKELAASLRKALEGSPVAEGDYNINNKTGAIEFKDGVLFDLGSWKISAKGAAILKAIADTQRSNVVKVVGHTDKKPITRAATKAALDTDTNMELSTRRAVAVMGELMKHGMRESQFASVEGHGTEATERNGVARCVEIFVVKGAQVAPTSFEKKPAKTTKK